MKAFLKKIKPKVVETLIYVSNFIKVFVILTLILIFFAMAIEVALSLVKVIITSLIAL